MIFVGNEVPYQSALLACPDNKGAVDNGVLPLDDNPASVGSVGIEPTHPA